MPDRLADAKCDTQALINSHLLNFYENMRMDIKVIRIANLRELIRSRSDSAADFARTYGLDPSHISQMMNGHRGFGEKAARKIEAQVGLPSGSLDVMGGDNVTLSEPLPGVVPVISWISAGAWCESPDNYSLGDAEEWMPRPKNAGPHTFALKVVNDSMTNPGGQRSYPEGVYIFVDPDKALFNGARVVARSGGEYTFKQYVEDAGRKYLKPLNPAYKMIDITEGAHICGVVVGSYMPE
jgi:SOS-response transcriptional repressor LexA